MAGLPTVLWLQHYRNFRTDKLRGGLRSAPCDPELWVSSIAEALEQHRLTTKEEVLAEFKKSKLKGVKFAHKKHASWLRLVIWEDRRSSPVKPQPTNTDTAVADRLAVAQLEVASEKAEVARDSCSAVDRPWGVVSASWSPDSTLCAVGFHDAVWLCHTGAQWPPTGWERPQRLGTAHTDSISTLRFSPCGTLLAVGSWDCGVSIVSSPSWNVTAKLDNVHEEMNTTLCWRPDATQLALGSADGSVSLVMVEMNVQTQEHRVVLVGKKILHSDGITSMAWSPDGSRLALGADDTSVIIVSTVTWEPIAKVEDDGIRASVVCLSWAPRGLGRLAVGSSDGALNVLDARSWSVMWSKDCTVRSGADELSESTLPASVAGAHVDALHDRVSMVVDWDERGDCSFTIDMAPMPALLQGINLVDS